MVTRTIAERLSEWTRLNNNLEDLLAEIPRLVPLQAEFEEILTEANRLEVRQAEATALLRQINEQRAQVAARGQEVRGRIGDLLRSRFGTRSIRLIQYGFRPRSGGRPRRKGAPPPGEPAPKAAK